jgi:hypothetical protein
MQYAFEVGVRLLFDALQMLYYSSINLGFKIVETGIAVIFVRPGYINPYTVRQLLHFRSCLLPLNKPEVQLFYYFVCLS